jgi:D-tyrosyl-tRNA(Tyr) deacylase
MPVACVLIVSQFTLYGVLKGNKPDFHVAMPPQKAKPFYESLVDKFRKAYRPDAIKGTLICLLLFVFVFGWLWYHVFISFTVSKIFRVKKRKMLTKVSPSYIVILYYYNGYFLKYFFI